MSAPVGTGLDDAAASVLYLGALGDRYGRKQMVLGGMALRAVVSRDPAKVHAGLPGMQVVPDVDALVAKLKEMGVAA